MNDAQRNALKATLRHPGTVIALVAVASVLAVALAIAAGN